MPAPAIKMHFSSPPVDPYTIRSLSLSHKNAPVSLPVKPTHLHSPMVSRIHNTPPGCSSCGKR